MRVRLPVAKLFSALTLSAHALTTNAAAQCFPDFYEPNNSLAEAASIFTVDPFGSANGSLSGEAGSSDLDYFSIPLPAGTFLRLDLEGSGFPFAFAPVGELFDETGTLLQTAFASNDPATAYIAWANESGQSVDLAFRVSDSQCNSYSLRWQVYPQPCQFDPTPDDALEPNDDCNLPTNMLLGNGIYGGLYASRLAPDYYRVDLEPGEKLEASLIYSFIFSGFGQELELALRSACVFDGSALLAQSSGSTQPFEMLSFENTGSTTESYSLEVKGGLGLGGTAMTPLEELFLPLPIFGACNTYSLQIEITDNSNSVAYCFGNGNSLVDCPCGNNSSMNHPGGCAHQDGDGAILEVSGIPSVQADTLAFSLTSAVRDSVALLVSGDNALPQMAPCIGCGIEAFDGLRCAGGNLIRHGIRALSTAGHSVQDWGFPSTPGGLTGQGAFSAGQTRHFFALMRTDIQETCGLGQNSSNGVRVTFLP